MSRLPFALWLVAVWVALWGELSAANLVGGVLAAAGVSAAFPRAGPRHARRFRPVAALRYLAVFLWLLLKANAIVAWEVVTPRSRIREGIIAVPLLGVSDAVVTLVANSITLTPGTLTVEAHRDDTETTLYVHVLLLHDIDAARRDVRHLEYRAIQAFGSEAARRACPDPRSCGSEDSLDAVTFREEV